MKRLLVSIKEAGTPESTEQRDLLDAMGSAFGWNDSMLSANWVYEYCLAHSKNLSRLIEDVCKDFEICSHANNGKVNRIVPINDKQFVRVVVYSGNSENLKDLRLTEATHTMFIRFNSELTHQFIPTVQLNYPIFYQDCISIDIATRYIEALLIDSCMCHYMKVSDAAMHHDEKQRISYEKTEFIRELANNIDTKSFTEDAKILIKEAAKRLTDTTPYISLFSIFTILPKDIAGRDDGENIKDNLEDNIKNYFEDYRLLWELFRNWYYEKHGLIFRDENSILYAVANIFDRNKFKGQMSDQKLQKELTAELTKYKALTGALNPQLYVIIILAKQPSNEPDITNCTTIFGKKMRPSRSWIIVPIDNLHKYNHIKEFVEIVPFMLGK